MGRKDIKLAQINARLGDMNKPRQYDSYNDDQPEFDNRDDGGSTFNAGFIASVIALFVAVSGGTYMFSSGINPMGLLTWRPVADSQTEFASKVDSICKPLWHSPGFNNDALACYMIERPDRFCDVQEREHFVGVFRRYRMDIELQKGKVIAEVVSGNLFKELDKAIEDQDNGIKRPEPKPRPLNKYLSNEKVDMVQAMKKFSQNVLDSSKRTQNPELSGLLRKLLEKGYFQLSEFGTFPDPLVTDATFEFPVGVKSPCSQTKSLSGS